VEAEAVMDIMVQAVVQVVIVHLMELATYQVETLL
jgi:hypothetical protein